MREKMRVARRKLGVTRLPSAGAFVWWIVFVKAAQSTCGQSGARLLRCHCAAWLTEKAGLPCGVASFCFDAATLNQTMLCSCASCELHRQKMYFFTSFHTLAHSRATHLQPKPKPVGSSPLANSPTLDSPSGSDSLDYTGHHSHSSPSRWSCSP
jgi:hypothetical protein